jgi:peptidoglycan-associated lipoprotein
MRARIKTSFALFLLLAIAAVSARPAVAQTSTQPTTAMEQPLRAEVAVDYSYLHSNAPPSGCGCFNMNGGSADFAWAIKPGSWALVGDVVSDHAGGVSSAGYSITLSAFTAGVRYLPPFGHSSLHPFGQTLLGVAHSSGTLVQAPNAGSTNSGAAFAANIGGGLDLSASRRFSIRLIEADYLLTTFDNGSNNHQNNLRISAGVVFKFRGR